MVGPKNFDIVIQQILFKSDEKLVWAYEAYSIQR